MPDSVLKAQSHLTDRDHTLLGWLYDHGVLTTPQIANALYPSLDFAQKRLARLVALGVIDRFRPQRPVGGSYPFHYLLDQLGTDVVIAQRTDDPVPRAQARQRRWHLTNKANLVHLLGTNQFFTDLAGHARTHPTTSLVRWWSARQCANPGLFSTLAGAPVGFVPVRPDGHGIWAQDGAYVPFWLEYDTGTEPIGTLVNKITAYSTKLPPVASRLKRWPVLFSLHSAHREHHLHQALNGITTGIPVATSTRQLNVTAPAETSPAGQVWWLHRDTQPRRTLIELPRTNLSPQDLIDPWNSR